MTASTVLEHLDGLRPAHADGGVLVDRALLARIVTGALAPSATVTSKRPLLITVTDDTGHRAAYTVGSYDADTDAFHLTAV